MTFWDSSALVPLLVREAFSGRMSDLLSRDPEPVMWWTSTIECTSALWRVHREGRLDLESVRRGLAGLDILADAALQILPSEEVRQQARHLLAVHPLRVADAQQLAAALVWCRNRAEGRGFAWLDDRLRVAANGEGFEVLP